MKVGDLQKMKRGRQHDNYAYFICRDKKIYIGDNLNNFNDVLYDYEEKVLELLNRRIGTPCTMADLKDLVQQSFASLIGTDSSTRDPAARLYKHVFVAIHNWITTHLARPTIRSIYHGLPPICKERVFTAALVFKRFGLPKDVAHYLLEFLYTRDEVRIMTRFVADRHAGTITRQSAYIDRFWTPKWQKLGVCLHDLLEGTPIQEHYAYEKVVHFRLLVDYILDKTLFSVAK